MALMLESCRLSELHHHLAEYNYRRLQPNDVHTRRVIRAVFFLIASLLSQIDTLETTFGARLSQIN